MIAIARLSYWCDTSSVAAVELHDEIVEMVGQWAYDRMVELIDRPQWTPLPHPAVRR